MEYNDLTLTELKKIAKENNITNISKLSKYNKSIVIDRRWNKSNANTK